MSSAFSMLNAVHLEIAQVVAQEMLDVLLAVILTFVFQILAAQHGQIAGKCFFNLALQASIRQKIQLGVATNTCSIPER